MSTMGFWGLDTSHSVIVGTPNNFSLATALSQATTLKMAVAFMNEGGLKMILNALNPTQVEVEIMVGLNFGFTHPKALKRLLNVQKNFKRADFRVILPNKSRNNVFHPKIMLIRGEEASFALVGSANCTEGGYDANCECSAYIDSTAIVNEIEALIEKLKSSKEQYLSVPLTSKLIADYEKQWAKMKKPAQQLKGLDLEIDKHLTKTVVAQIKKWDELVKAAKQFAQNTWPGLRAEYQQAVANIKTCLEYPDFTHITKAQWHDFYKEEYLGHLIPIRRDVAFREIDKLSTQLRQLIDESIPLTHRIDKMLTQDKIYGIGINLVSKILTCHNPDKYPTWNNPVIASLSDFGFELPWGATEGQKYAAFQQKMLELKKEAGLENMLALDAFLYAHYAQSG